jgi:hypothetical protein
MPVGDFARSFREAVSKEGTELLADVTVTWLSGKGHQDPVVRDAPTNVLTRLSRLPTRIRIDYSQRLNRKEMRGHSYGIESLLAALERP